MVDWLVGWLVCRGSITFAGIDFGATGSLRIVLTTSASISTGDVLGAGQLRVSGVTSVSISTGLFSAGASLWLDAASSFIWNPTATNFDAPLKLSTLTTIGNSVRVTQMEAKTSITLGPHSLTVTGRLQIPSDLTIEST